MILQPNKVKGDTLLFEFSNPNTNIADWKIRAEVYDKSANRIKLANTESGGDDNQIEVTDDTNGEFTVKVQKNLTTCFDRTSYIEVEVENTVSPTQIFTILQAQIILDTQKITWTSPS